MKALDRVRELLAIIRARSLVRLPPPPQNLLPQREGETFEQWRERNGS